MANDIRIAPSVLSADLTRLTEQVAQVVEGGATSSAIGVETKRRTSRRAKIAR